MGRRRMIVRPSLETNLFSVMIPSRLKIFSHLLQFCLQQFSRHRQYETPISEEMGEFRRDSLSPFASHSQPNHIGQSIAPSSFIPASIYTPDHPALHGSLRPSWQDLRIVRSDLSLRKPFILT